MGKVEMKGRFYFNSDYAVSEVVGAILLVLIAIVVFSVIYLNVTSQDLSISNTNVKIVSLVEDNGSVILQHKNGDTIKNYKIAVSHPNGTLIGSKTCTDGWQIGESRYPLENITSIKLTDETISLIVAVYNINDKGDEEEIFNAELFGKPKRSYIYLPEDTPDWDSTFPLLISSLRNDSTDEDLICFNFTENISINPNTFIYRWMQNGESFAEILLPFDTQSSLITKDYSGHNLDGTVSGPEWKADGIVGGCFYFDGSSDYITSDLPSGFNEGLTNDLTVSMWIKSSDVHDDNRILLHASLDNKNFVKIFQSGTQIHFGVCYNGIKDAIRTENITDNTWYHITGTWDANVRTIGLYINDEECTETGIRTFALGSDYGFELGHGSASSRFWYGYIDEVQFFDRLLSKEQIYQNYLCTKDGFCDKSIIVSDETSNLDIWNCVVTPNDSTQDGTAVESNYLQITNYIGGD